MIVEMCRKLYIFILIFALAIALRVYQLDKVSPALFGDEVDVGYQAYSILKTGKDLYGRFLPVYIKSLSEYRAPLYIYSTVPFVGIFGLNEWGVRLPAVFWGVAGVIGLYLLLNQLFNSRIATFGALILGFSPWHIHYSRASFEVTMLLAFLIFATYFFVLFFEEKQSRAFAFLIISAALFGLTLYIYSTAILFTPLLIILLVVIHKNSFLRYKKIFLTFSLALFLVTLPMIWSMYSGEARGRFSVINIFQESVLLNKINLARSGQEFFTPEGEVKQTDPKWEFIFHNKPAIFAQVFTLNYLRAFSFDFLFAEGDPNFRHSIHEMGLLYLVELPLVIFGLWALIKTTAKKTLYIIIGWLLIAPIPAALTFDGGFHATRLSIMLPPLVTLSALGLYKLLTQSNVFFRPLKITVIVLALVGVIFYLHRYFVHYPVESWRWWHVGFKEAINFIKDEQHSYKTVIINNSYEPSLERYLFFTQYDPSLFHQQFVLDQHIRNILPGVDGFRLGEKLYFGKINDEARKLGGFEYIMKPNMLYMASSRDELIINEVSNYKFGNFKIVKSIFDPSGEPIFYILSGKND